MSSKHDEIKTKANIIGIQGQQVLLVDEDVKDCVKDNAEAVEKYVKCHVDAKLDQVEKSITGALNCKINDLQKNVSNHVDAKVCELEGHVDKKFCELETFVEETAAQIEEKVIEAVHQTKCDLKQHIDSKVNDLGKSINKHVDQKVDGLKCEIGGVKNLVQKILQQLPASNGYGLPRVCIKNKLTEDVVLSVEYTYPSMHCAEPMIVKGIHIPGNEEWVDNGHTKAENGADTAPRLQGQYVKEIRGTYKDPNYSQTKFIDVFKVEGGSEVIHFVVDHRSECSDEAEIRPAKRE